MKNKTWCITKWCKSITDSRKDEYTKNKIQNGTAKFRLLDDDGVVYAYGVADIENIEDEFEPLDYYMYSYGCTTIQYKNEKTKEYETL